jgi:competence protein ComEC
MGRKRKNKNKFSIDRFVISIVITLAILAYIFVFEPNINLDFLISNQSAEVDATSISYDDLQIDSSKFNVLYLYVGQADSAFITIGEKTMLIDAGNDSDGDYIVQFLTDQGISKIDYLIGTHIDEDHIGGMDEVINAFEIGHLYMPYSTSDKTTYKNVKSAIEKKGSKIENVKIGDNFKLDSVACKVMSVDNTEKESSNDSSIVMQLTYKNNKFLFMGDLSETGESKINWEDVDVLKVGHHGSNSSSSESFLKQVKPEYSVISDGVDNKYGHPGESTLKRLNNIGTAIFRTDTQGTIWITSDGDNIEVKLVDINLDGATQNSTSCWPLKSYDYEMCA